MCLIVIAHRFSSRFRFVAAANRDEEYARPSREAGWWDDAPVLGGRDLRQGGSWLAITRTGRLAAITNVRAMEKPDAPSRGELVRNYVRSTASADAFIRSIATELYAGFHLICGEVGGAFAQMSNVDGAIRPWSDGIHGISNAMPGTMWPKVERATAHVGELIEAATDASALAGNLIEFLGTPGEMPRLRGSTLREELSDEVFVMSDRYGTRSSTAIVVEDDRCLFVEQNYGPGGLRLGEPRHFRVQLAPPGAR